MLHGPETTRRVIRVDGVFDAEAAVGLGRTLADVRGEDVEIDLSQVHSFDDFAVMLLGRALAARRAGVTVRGLRAHHLRLLRYLGYEEPAVPA